jgi:hypothetical protein
MDVTPGFLGQFFLSLWKACLDVSSSTSGGPAASLPDVLIGRNCINKSTPIEYSSSQSALDDPCQTAKFS